MKNKTLFTIDQIKEAISNTTTMGGAAKYLRVDWRVFRREAKEYGLYVPSKGSSLAFKIEDILDGKYPQYPTSKLSKRLVKEGYKKYECEVCGIDEYNGEHISLELNHIDGESSNHSLDNLQLVCPNCHSQTPTYRSKKLVFRRVGELVSNGS
jgi:hypothetical protein